MNQKVAASWSITVYLVDKRLDMLSSLLGTDLYSLRLFTKKLDFKNYLGASWISGEYELSVNIKTPDANVVNMRFTKSVIASRTAFTYEACVS